MLTCQWFSRARGWVKSKIYKPSCKCLSLRPSMLLYQYTSTIWDTTFRNAEGQVIYKTENPTHPHSRSARQIIIKRILPSNSIDLATASEDALRDAFSDVAEIHFGLLSSSRIRYNGIDMDTSQFFRKSNILSR